MISFRQISIDSPQPFPPQLLRREEAPHVGRGQGQEHRERQQEEEIQVQQGKRQAAAATVVIQE